MAVLWFDPNDMASRCQRFDITGKARRTIGAGAGRRTAERINDTPARIKPACPPAPLR